MEQLKRCPLCGGDVIVYKGKCGCYNIMCKTIFCCQFPVSAKTEAEAIAAWNTRIPMKQIVERLEEWKNTSQMEIEELAFKKALEIVNEEIG